MFWGLHRSPFNKIHHIDIKSEKIQFEAAGGGFVGSVVMASRRPSGGNLCCLPLCRSRKYLDSNLHFHRFPSNSELSETWLKFVNRPDLYRKTCKELNNTYKVCSRHFEPDMYMSPISPRLKHSAVPTIPVQENISQGGTLSVESTVAVPSSKIDIPDAIATECVEESDGPLHIFIPSTDSEKGSSRDSMAAEPLDDWGYFDGGGGNDPLEVTSISSDIPKEEANSHEKLQMFLSCDMAYGMRGLSGLLEWIARDGEEFSEQVELCKMTM
ncbi:uncharacterized protein LOC134771910 [Penaeus indicus]|uniref:uncharacterized protein LOC134771910 n=1 Tax=Penaeus indicus TaxID=29960 RepID=UPI00300C57CC